MKEFILPSGDTFIAPQMVEIPVKWYIIPVQIPLQHATIDSNDSLGLKGNMIAYASKLTEIYDISFERLKKIIECESQFSPKAYNPKDTDGFPKFGLLQFHKPTFYGAGGKDIWSWQEQLDIGVKMMADGYWNRWPTCSK